ncbi:MAG: hypothetical protein Ct9H90mP13_12810 [Pseudomonadota bacterium]|nr:MAG: hypothetical protein Ct9H90mP13_12810 [Pseudomonadota bacterium]
MGEIFAGLKPGRINADSITIADLTGVAVQDLSLPKRFKSNKGDMIDTKYKILIRGLPGSGKTYLAERLVPILNAAWYNADKLREMANDWDFSDERQKKAVQENENLC